MSEGPIAEALARLDADLAAAEARVADLKLKRQGALAFLAYLDEPIVRPRAARPAVSSGSPSSVFEEIIKDAGLTDPSDPAHGLDLKRLLAQPGRIGA